MNINQSFENLNLPEHILKILNKMAYASMTPIQKEVIPLALLGRDILGTSHTGSGKTAAFTIPVITKILTTPKGTALILTPTRELAIQVNNIVKIFLQNSSQTTPALLIGGESIALQIKALRANPRIIIGTPGRIKDHLERRTLKLHENQMFIMDEADRTLDMGFKPQLEAILKSLPQGQQTLMFSATFSQSVLKISEKYLNNPACIHIGNLSPATKPDINQIVLHVPADKKYDILKKELEKKLGTVIIFVKTKIAAEKIAYALQKNGFEAESIHGNLRQSQRKRVIDLFRKQKYTILVATDVVARGLDISHIEHVINYNIPQNADDYIHRIGRTARAGAKGCAVTFVCPEEKRLWKLIEKQANITCTHDHSYLPASKTAAIKKPFKPSHRKNEAR